MSVSLKRRIERIERLIVAAQQDTDGDWNSPVARLLAGRAAAAASRQRVPEQSEQLRQRARRLRSVIEAQRRILRASKRA